MGMNEMRDKLAGLELDFTEGGYDICTIKEGHTHLLPTGIDKILSLETKTHRIAVIPRGESPLAKLDKEEDPSLYTFEEGASAQKKLSDEFYRGE